MTRAALTLAALAAVASCGGGGGELQGPEPATSDRAKPLAFEPPGPVPADAALNGMWSGVYPWPLVSVHSAILPDGRVLTYGSDLTGLQTGHSVYDIWDPNGAPDTGHLTLPNTSGTDLFCSSQVLLPGGKVFIAGGDVWTGSRVTNTPNNNSNLIDAGTGTITRGVAMQRARWYASSTTLVSGETYIQGGTGGGDRPEVRGLNGSFRLMTGIDTSAIGTAYPRNFVAPDGRVFGYHPSNGAMYWISTAGTGSLTPAGTFNAALSGGWESSAAMYRPGRILQIGGNSNGAYTIDITGSTPVVRTTQAMSSRRAWVNATLLADGKVLATSGSAVPGEATGVNNIAEIWDPATGLWRQGAVAQKMRLYHSNAILLPDASVLVSGGGATQPTPLADPNKNNLNAEIYYPPYLFTAGGTRAARPQITSAPGYVDIGQTFPIGVADAASVSRVTFVKTGSVSHSVNFDQRFLELTFAENGAGSLSVQAPTHAAEATPGFYLLFVFDAAGVPSVARIVRVGIASDPNPALTPAIVNPGSQTTLVGDAVTLGLGGTDPNGDALTWAAAGLPPGLSIDRGIGRITGTAAATGSYDVVVTASDGINASSIGFQWLVQNAAPLALAQPPAPPFVVTDGVATYTATATGGANLRYRWNFGDGTPTTGWSASSTVTHAYATGGTYLVTVSVTDETGVVLTRSFTQAVYLPATARRPQASGNVVVETPAAGNARLWVVNQDHDSVSVFDAVTLVKLGEVAVGKAPRAVAVAPDGSVWVANKQSATISVIDPATRSVVRTIALGRGTQPFGLVMSPVADLAYVALEAGGSVLRFDTANFVQTGSVAVGANVRHLSISGDGTTLYASRFITPPLPGEATANVSPTPATGGEVVQIAAGTLAIVRTIVLAHGDKADGENQGRGIPNYLGAAVISPDGAQAYVPGKQDNVKRGALRDGTGLNFQNTVRAISARLVLASNAEDPARRIDHDNASVASAAVFEPRGVYLFVALETSREVAIVNAFNGAQLLRVDVGRAPQGLAVSADGRRLFVSNFMDRSVSVLDLGLLLDQGMFSVPTLATLATVDAEALEPAVLLGKQHFYDARDPRLARERYMSCASCHNDGGQDGRVWDLTGLGEGLRNTISLRGRGGAMGFLHWSNNFDEVQDFEGQIRSLAGGSGLMNDADFAGGTRAQPLGDRKVGYSVDLDALAAYVASLSTFDASPARPSAAALSATAAEGKAIFAARQCAACHAGTAFSGSGENTLVGIGTLKPSSGQRLGAPLAGIDVPTLRDVWATAPYLHDGSAPTLAAAVRAHAGTTIGDADLAKLVAYLREIGGDEAAAPAPAGTGTGLAASYFNNLSLAAPAALTRTEAIDFGWGTGAPGIGVTADNFSVRWTGTLVPPATGTYRFRTESDDGVRLWVNGVQVVNNWTNHAPTVDTGAAMNLVAGRPVPIVVEYFERGGGAVMRLHWQPPGETGFVAVPASHLLPQAPPVNGTGLAAGYFNNTTLSGTPVLRRTEAIDFNWGTGSPGAGVAANNFSVRWSGTVLAPTTGSYRFQTQSDDGVRVWVDGVRVIDNWTDHAPTTNTSGAITLAGGVRYDIVVEYYEKGGGALMRLQWSTPGTTGYAAVPAVRLFP